MNEMKPLESGKSSVLTETPQEESLHAAEEAEPELTLRQSPDVGGAGLLIVGTVAAFSVNQTAGFLMSGLTLGVWMLLLGMHKRRVEFWRHEARLISDWVKVSVAYSDLDCSGAPGPLARFGWKSWKIKGRYVLVYLPKWSTDGLPADDQILQKLVEKGVPVSAPWGTKAGEAPPAVSSVSWRVGEKVKWIYSLPSIFWIGAVIVAYRSGLTPWGDAVIFFIVGSIPLLFLTATALLRVSRKGSIEFSPEGVKIISKGVVLFESSMSDLRKLQIRTRRRNILGSQKRLVLVTQYSREIPLTEFAPSWDKTGERAIAEALRRGIPVEIVGDPSVPKALEGPPD